MYKKDIVNVKLYEFLKKHDTGMYIFQDEEVRIYVAIPFDNIKEFIEIVGCGWTHDGGLEVLLFEDSITIEINGFILDGECHLISSYKDCFNETDWEEYKDLIMEMEGGYYE